jgi:hypothetical protein
LHFDLVFTGVAAKHLTIRSGLLDELPRGQRQFLSCETKRTTASSSRCSMRPAPWPSTSRHRPDVRLTSFRVPQTRDRHIATGYDHLLFLLGLLLVVVRPFCPRSSPRSRLPIP